MTVLTYDIQLDGMVVEVSSATGDENQQTQRTETKDCTLVHGLHNLTSMPRSTQPEISASIMLVYTLA